MVANRIIEHWNDMKRNEKMILLVLLIVLNSTSCSIKGANIFTFNNGTIVPNSQFNDIPYLANEDINLSHTQTASFSANGITISLEKFSGWEEDPGYFTVIKSLTNDVPFMIKSSIAWDCIPEAFRTGESDYYIRVPLNNDYTALILMGYPFDSRPPFLTIIVVGNGQAAMVFNKRYVVSSLVNTSESFSMTLQGDYIEYSSSGQPVSTPDTFRIWLENGVLMFEQILN